MFSQVYVSFCDYDIIINLSFHALAFDQIHCQNAWHFSIYSQPIIMHLARVEGYLVYFNYHFITMV